MTGAKLIGLFYRDIKRKKNLSIDKGEWKNLNNNKKKDIEYKEEKQIWREKYNVPLASLK